MTSFAEPQRATQTTSNGWLSVEASSFVYGPFNYSYRLNGGHSGLRDVIGGARPCVETGEQSPSSMKSPGLRVYTQQTDSMDFQRQHLGERRKSVWFEVVCGSPSCGSGGAHSSQCQGASLDGDLRAGPGCCRLDIRGGQSVAPATKRKNLPL